MPPSKLEEARATPKLKEAAKRVEALEADVQNLRAKQGTTGFPVTAYPPPTQDVGTVDLFQGTKGRGYASHGMHTDLRAWYAQQLAIVEAELMRERAAMQQKMQADYELQLRNVHFQLEEMKLKRLEELQLKREIRLRDEMEYRAKVGKKEDIIIVTTATVPGYRIKDVCGAVMGFGLIDDIHDDEEDEEESMEEELLLSPHLARVQAVEHMLTDAQRCQATAIINFHWIIRPLDAFRTKVLAQGTAVMIEKDGPVQCGECGTVKKKQKGEGGDNQKGNSGNYNHSHDPSASSGSGTASADAQKQKQQKGKGGGGVTNGAGGGKGQAQQQAQQGKKNKGKQNAVSKETVDDKNEGNSDDDNDNDNDNAQNSDADGDDDAPHKSNKQKGKGQNNQNKGDGGGGGKGGKGQKLTPAQQLIKLLTEAKIREDRQKAEETEKERLYKHMENYFKDRKIDSGFGASSRSMTTMDWLKKIEKEIEDRNKKKDGKGTSENSGVAGWGQVTNKSLGRDNQPEPAIEPREVGWDTPDNKPADTANDSKGKQKDKGNQKKDNHAGQGTQGKTQNVWIVPGGSKQPSQTVGGGGTGKGWDDEDKAGPTTESAPNNNSGNFVWGDEPPAGARIADPWQNPNIGASANIEQARSSGGDGWI